MKQFKPARPGDHELPPREALGLWWQCAAVTLLTKPGQHSRKRHGALLPAAVQDLRLPRDRVTNLAIVVAALGVAFAPLLIPAQMVAPGVPGVPLPFLQGPTLADTLRNGAQMASNQSRLTAQFAADMSQRARSGGYQRQNFLADYQNLEYQFQNLQFTFNALGQQALQLKSPRAANAVAELESGLNIIAEAFTPMQQDIQAGTFNPDTVQRMCGALNQALLEWQKELKRCSSRLGTMR